MHPSLEIQEILRLIIVQVIGHKSLASMALTCRAFLEPVLDEMWHTQANLVPWLRCFPADAISVELISHEYIIRILRPILPADWQRPLFYAHRIRTYQAFEGKNMAEALGVLSMSLPEGHLLLPKLDTLLWAHSDVSTCFFIRLFLAPSLRTLHIMSYPLLLSLLPRLPDMLPNLETVTVQITLDSVNEAAHGPPISLFVQNLASLVFLNVPVAGWSDLTHLAGLRRLKSLEIHHLVGDASGSFPSDAFSALRSLRLTSARTEAIIQFFQAVSSLDLGLLELRVNDLMPTATTTSLYNLIANRCSASTLTVLEHHMELPDGRTLADEELHAYKITSATLRELSGLRGLKRLSLTSPAGFELDDAGMLQLARSLPQLEELLLVDPLEEDDDEDEDADNALQPRTVTGVTLAGIRELAEHCPNLIRLALSFDAKVLPSPRGPMPGKPRGTPSRVSQLEVRNSVLDDSIGVARFLSGLFPDAEIFSDEYNNAPLNERWESVSELMEPFVAAREEERTWTRHEMQAIRQEMQDIRHEMQAIATTAS
ncbi:hypothetical protein C8F01DRAFT_1185936 [Mycena amicta]|nr:hypothetical protein C8F01DRAFT_1185936 [Mycena amicta]